MPPARIAPPSPRVSDRTGIRWPASSGGGPPEEDVDDGPHAGIPRPRTAVRGVMSKRVQRPDVRDGYDRVPVRRRSFDAVLCALGGEQLSNLRLLFREIRDGLVRGGRFVFSVFHPEMAAAGIEADFERDGVEYRLGALRHTVADYLNLIDGAGFRGIAVHEFRGDDVLVEQVP